MTKERGNAEIDPKVHKRILHFVNSARTPNELLQLEPNFFAEILPPGRERPAVHDPLPLEDILRKLARDVNMLVFREPVCFVYNPLDYAWAAQAIYLQRYGQGKKEALFLGMNPGPFGMAQTGVPFGEIAAVRDWMGIEAAVDKPANEHPKRAVTGFACTRSEVSGRRLWGWAQERFGTPEKFFERFFVLNYCPLVFMLESGRNLTPDKLPADARAPLFEVCDHALYETVRWLRPRRVIGLGKLAEKSARRVLADLDLEFGFVLHPSPASPAAVRATSSESCW